jgi:TetR/AcrR family transcriptional regulator of autoinduction and epiphytic fitness
LVRWLSSAQISQDQAFIEPIGSIIDILTKGTEMTDQTAQVQDTPAPPGRHAAGQDPAKRHQILTGAKAVFMQHGFDAASMNDICRAAGVSKGTLYVYFDSKEDLFEAMVEQERDQLFAGVPEILSGPDAPEDRLFRYGCRVAAIVCSEDVVRAQRIIIGIAARMPDLGARFFQTGAQRAQTELGKFLTAEVAAGRMAIANVPLAAAQFLDLAVSDLWRPRIFGKMPSAPNEAEIAQRVQSALAMFLAVHACR